jgi:hypothetical protein
MTDPAWIHIHHGHGVEGAGLGILISKGTPDGGDFLDLATTGLQLRYTVRGAPVSDWLNPPFAFTLSAANPLLPALDGIHDLSTEIQGPDIEKYRPVRSYLHLYRGHAVEPTVPIISQDNELDQGCGPGVVYVNVNDRQLTGYPVDPSVTAWHTDPEHTPDLYQEMLQPHAEQYQPAQMWWEEPPGTVSAGLPFVRGLQPKLVGVDFRIMYAKSFQTEDGPKAGGLRNMPFRDGPRGVGWTDSLIQGVCDSQGGLAFISVGGPLRYLKPDGELVTVVGWRVKPDKFPVWILKSYATIRQNMELRGVWLDGQYADDPGFHSPMDVTIDPQDENVWYVAGFHDHCIWKVVVDRTTWVGTVSVFAGDPNHTAGYANGTGTAARFQGPSSLVFDPVADVLYVADQDNDAIRKVTRAGVVSTVCGSPGMGQRIQAAGGVSCALEFGTNYMLCSDAAENRARSKFETPAGVKPDIYAPFCIRVDSKGNIILLETSYTSIRRINPLTGETTRLANAGESFSDRGWAWIDVDRWGNSGPKDGIFWAASRGTQIDGNPGSVTNEIVAWVQPEGGPQQFVFKNTYAPVVGWGENGVTRVPHYSWLVAVDPRGGLYMSGLGDHGITRARKRKPTDYVFPDASTFYRYVDAKTSLWRYGSASGNIGYGSFPYDNKPANSFILKHGNQGHNYLGFADAWGLAPDATDAQISAAFGIPPEMVANSQQFSALTNFLRINGQQAAQPVPVPVPDPTPDPTPDPEPPPAPDPCVVDPLVFVVKRWPAGTTGSRRFDYSSNKPVQVTLNLLTTPWKVVATDARGCAVTVTK